MTTSKQQYEAMYKQGAVYGNIIGWIFMIIHIGALYFLYTLQKGACSCAQGRDLDVLFTLGSMMLLLGIVSTFLNNPVLAIISFFINVAFIYIGYYYLQKIESCGCIVKSSAGNIALQIAIYTRLVLFVGTVVLPGAVLLLVVINSMIRNKKK